MVDLDIAYTVNNLQTRSRLLAIWSNVVRNDLNFYIFETTPTVINNTETQNDHALSFL